MDKLGTGSQSVQKPGGHGAPTRKGGSGEGARSALERLLQQERNRNAQQPRDTGAPAAPGEPAS